MTWYINTGDDLSRSQKITFTFFRTLPESYTDNDLIFRDTITVSEKAKAPTYPGQDTRTYVDAVSDLRNAPKSAFRTVTGRDGKQYVKVDFELTMTPMSGLFKFACEIDGVEYGKVEAKYD